MFVKTLAESPLKYEYILKNTYSEKEKHFYISMPPYQPTSIPTISHF